MREELLRGGGRGEWGRGERGIYRGQMERVGNERRKQKRMKEKKGEKEGRGDPTYCSHHIPQTTPLTTTMLGVSQQMNLG